MPTVEGTVQTPLGAAVGRRVDAQRRRGAGAARRPRHARRACSSCCRAARVGHIGLQRDETTAVASRYYAKLPPRLEDDVVLMTDPMLATGGSAVAALDLLRAAGARDIRIVCIVAAPEGIARVERRYPDVPIYTPVVDRELNAQKFIVPGLGDFGDRLFGTV